MHTPTHTHTYTHNDTHMRRKGRIHLEGVDLRKEDMLAKKQFKKRRRRRVGGAEFCVFFPTSRSHPCTHTHTHTNIHNHIYIRMYIYIYIRTPRGINTRTCPSLQQQRGSPTYNEGPTENTKEKNKKTQIRTHAQRYRSKDDEERKKTKRRVLSHPKGPAGRKRRSIGCEKDVKTRRRRRRLTCTLASARRSFVHCERLYHGCQIGITGTHGRSSEQLFSRVSCDSPPPRSHAPRGTRAKRRQHQYSKKKDLQLRGLCW